MNKIIINTLFSCSILLFFSGSYAEVKAAPTKEEELAKQLRQLSYIANELFTTETTYVVGLKTLLAMEKTLRASESGVLWLTYAQDKKDQIKKQNYGLNNEIKNINELVSVSEELKNYFQQLSVNFSNQNSFMSNIYHNVNSIIDQIYRKFDENNTYVQYVKFITSHTAMPDSELIDFNHKKYITLDGKRIGFSGIDDLRNKRILPTQRMPRYKLLMESLNERMLEWLTNNLLKGQVTDLELVKTIAKKISEVAGKADEIAKKVNKVVREFEILRKHQ